MKPRAHVVDLLRLVMSVQMIQGHVIDALLARELRHGPVFETWTWVRGLTAVGFLVAAGLSFHLSSLVRWDTYRSDRAARSRRVRRAGMLIVIGYLLRAPAGALSPDPELVATAWREAAIVDVLQCIGVTMLALEALVSIARTSRQVVVASGALAALLIGTAPVAARIDCEGSPVLALCNYVSRSGGSLFPLLPWSGFVLAGVSIGALALPDGAGTRSTRTAGRLAVAAGIAIAASFALDAIVPRPSSDEPLVAGAAPAFSLARLGGVLALAAVLAIAGSAIRDLPRVLRTLAGETLVLYVSHLLILYVAGLGLARTIGPTLSIPVAIAVAVAVITVSVAIALAWARRRERVSARGRR